MAYVGINGGVRPAAATEPEQSRPDFLISSPRCPGSRGSAPPSPGSCLVEGAGQETDLGRGRSAVGVLVPRAGLANPCGSARSRTVCVPWGRTSPTMSRPWRSAAPSAVSPTRLTPGLASSNRRYRQRCRQPVSRLPARLVHQHPRRLAPPVSRRPCPSALPLSRRPDSPCSTTRWTETPPPSATSPRALGPMSCSSSKEPTLRHSRSAALRSAPRHFVGALGSADYHSQELIWRLLRGSGPD